VRQAQGSVSRDSALTVQNLRHAIRGHLEPSREFSRSTGVGFDIMKPITAPIIGGMVTSTTHVMIVMPAVFYLNEDRRAAA
jgi:hypothetical protein